MDLISSRTNPKIKQIRALRGRQGRQQSDLFLVEGIFHVGEAVAATQAGKLRLDSVFYAPELLKSEFALELVQGLRRQEGAARIPCYELTRQVFESIAEKDNPQGILAIARPVHYELKALDTSNFSWGVALVAPQDPGNLGTILRTIDAVGASGLLLLDSNLDPYHPSAVRASMGALFWYPLVQASFAEFASWVTERGYTVYGTSAHASTDYRRLTVAGSSDQPSRADQPQAQTYSKPMILLLGSERQGLTEEQVAVCHHLLRLPMLGHATSLNLAVAAGVMLYAMLE